MTQYRTSTDILADLTPIARQARSDGWDFTLSANGDCILQVSFTLPTPRRLTVREIGKCIGWPGYE